MANRVHDPHGPRPLLSLTRGRPLRALCARRHGTPDSKPTATAQKNADGSITVHAVWNGATEVARWIVIGGEHASALWPLGAGEWNGLDTAITLESDAQHVAVVAQDARGRLIGRSSSTVVSH